MNSGHLRFSALVATALLGSGLMSPAVQSEAARADGRLSAATNSERHGTIQIVFGDGSSVRLSSTNLARLDDFARAAGEMGGGSDPTLENAIVRLKSGRLRRLPVLLSGQSANAHASLAVHAAMRGDSETAQSALSRAKADVAGTALRHAPGWASVTRAHVTLAEAQLLDLDGRHEEAEALYRAGLDAVVPSASGGVADVQALLSAALSGNLARNLAAQGRGAEAQVAARRSVRAYVARFGQAPAYASGGLIGGAAGGFAQVAVNQMPGGAVVGQMLLTGVLIVTAIGPEASEDNVKDARGEPGGTMRSTGPLDDDSAVRESSGTAGGTSRSANGSANGSGDNGESRDASGEPGGTSRSSDGPDADGTSRDASGEAGGTSRSADGSGGSGTKDASGEAGGTSRSASGSGGDGTSKEARGEAGGTRRSGG